MDQSRCKGVTHNKPCSGNCGLKLCEFCGRLPPGVFPPGDSDSSRFCGDCWWNELQRIKKRGF